MKKLDQLLAQREVIFAKLLRIENYLKSFKVEDCSINQLKARLSIVNDARKEFEETQYDIEQADKEGAPSENLAIRGQFEDRYCDIVASINDVIDNYNTNTSRAQISASPAASVSNSTRQAESNLNLPVLNLKTYSGNYKDWLNFENSFKSVIDENQSLNNRQRFQYLKSCLRDEALRSIESLSINDNNYSKAWEVLEKRFKNTRLIVEDHVHSILNFPTSTKSSHTMLRNLLDTLTSNMTSLKMLDIPVDNWSALIIPIVVEKLDFHCKREWQMTLDTRVPTYKQFIDFLEKRCSVLESLASLAGNNKTPNVAANTNISNNQSKHSNQSYKPRTVAHVATNNIKTLLCNFCKNTTHNIAQCGDFLKLNAAERVTQVKNRNLCLNCLRDNHLLSRCRSNTKCRICNGKHHTLLHCENAEQLPVQVTPATITNHSLIDTDPVLLSTAVILIKNAINEYLPCRAFLDQGSMSNYMTDSLCKKLGLKPTKVNIEIKCLNGSTSASEKQARVEVKSRHNAYAAKLDCLVVNKITEDLPLTSINPLQLDIPENLKLADPKFYETGSVDLLVGARHFWDLLCIGQLRTPSGLILQKTHFGFIVGGSFKNKHSINLTCCNVSTTDGEARLEKQVANFWEIENFTGAKNLSLEEIECERHFCETTTRDQDGRFVVKLPKVNNKIDIGNTQKTALRRFYSLENKLNKNPELKSEYSKFMTEYLNLNHMELVTQTLDKDNCSYLPHHAVCKESSTTTKLRVVFDASLISDNGRSLNQNLKAGPVIQHDLFTITVRFRTFRYVLTGDITKMYRQIRMHPDDANYQLIFWRDNIQEPIKTYKLTTLTYGIKPASFIATRCLKELADENQTDFPIASEIIRRDFYMDDLLSGAESINELIKIKNDVCNILKQGGFELKKFHSNEEQILAFETDMTSSVDLNKNDLTKTLGLFWNPKDDVLKYVINLNDIPRKITKRNILSVTAQTFDPLGLLGPIIMKAKIIIQKLWSLKLGWDESVPSEIHSTWSTFLDQLKTIGEIQISRKITTSYPHVRVELHGFSDASIHGYAAAIYIRTIDHKGQYETHLLCSKSRVAPLKTITLPRLELCGALLLARLVQKVRQSVQLKIAQEYLWSDSSIVLAWINTPVNTLKCFVANRVAEINSLTAPANWRHVRSENNAADILSRGAFPSELANKDIWFTGPAFLKVDENNWPHSPINNDKIEIPDKRVTLLTTHKNKTEFPIDVTKYSNFETLRRIVAWVLRAINILSKGKYYNTNINKGTNLSTGELQNATVLILKFVQRTSEFAPDIENLDRNRPLNSSSKLLSLNPFLDTDGLLRVGGRLRHSPISIDIKHPIILPKSHFVTILIVRQEHERCLHAGPQATLAALRQRYWIVSAKSTIKQVLHYCQKCFRAYPKTPNPIMGDLPIQRVQPSRPFSTIGVDYAGPVMIRESRGRGKRLIKSYIAVFVCFSTKALHIELVADLSTEEFLGALKRLIGRRGHPTDIYSDNATTFHGAHNELKELIKFLKTDNFKNTFGKELTKIGINWHFIPPRSPHMGGIWEINIRSVKQHLKRTIGNAHLTFSEMNTLLVRIEACLNSRPLTPLSSNPNDLETLTPGHFLIGEPLTTLPEHDVSNIRLNRLSRWQLVERLRAHFWKRWSREYLTQLQGRSKWKIHQKAASPMEVGAMVLLMDDNAPPLCWRMGRITEVHRGADDVIRVVTVRTSQGLMKRAARKVCVLPLEK